MKSKDVNPKAATKKTQAELDHLEHYDLDGITREQGKVVIPCHVKMKKEVYGKSKGANA